MRTIRIYTPQTLAVHQVVALDEQACRHVATVLRLREGDTLVVFNGDGMEYRAQIVRVDKKRLDINVLECCVSKRESPLFITLCLALLKGEAMDFALQKAVELGVNRIVPFDCARAERHLSGDRALKKVQHWRKILISAAQQSGRTRLPALLEPVSFSTAIGEQAERRLVLSPHHRASGIQADRIASAALLIGPEGGFEPQEVDQAIRVGWQAWSLGARILRADTAVVSALSLVQFQYGDLS